MAIKERFLAAFAVDGYLLTHAGCKVHEKIMDGEY